MLNKIEINIKPNELPFKKLNLGCGDVYKEGYTNIDFPSEDFIFNVKKKPDIIGNFTEMNFGKENIESIWFSHAFEHFQRHDAVKLLIRFNYWLKNNGELDILVPDAEQCINEFVNTNSYKRKKELMRHFTGSHESFWAVHCEAYWKENLKEILESCGFQIVTCKQIGGQWPALHFNVIKYRSPDLEKIKKYLNDYSPNVGGYENVLLNYWIKEIKEEFNYFESK